MRLVLIFWFYLLCYAVEFVQALLPVLLLLLFLIHISHLRNIMLRMKNFMLQRASLCIFLSSVPYNTVMNKLKSYIIKGIIFALIVGAISHFVYEWSGENYFLGFFFPVNESTWEHMKLCFFPMLFYSLYMNGKVKEDYPCVTSALLFGILLSTCLIPVIFYTYSGILGRNFLILDIAAFAASVLLAFYAIYRFTLSCKLSSYTTLLMLLVLAVAVCFFIFTYHPLSIGIFMNPAEINVQHLNI